MVFAKQLIKDDSIVLEEKPAAQGDLGAEDSQDHGDSRIGSIPKLPHEYGGNTLAINTQSGDDLLSAPANGAHLKKALQSEQELPAKKFRRHKKQGSYVLKEQAKSSAKVLTVKQSYVNKGKAWDRHRALNASHSLKQPAFGKRNFSLQPGSQNPSKVQDSSTASLRQPPGLFIKKRIAGNNKRTSRQTSHSISNQTGATSAHLQSQKQHVQITPIVAAAPLEPSRKSHPDKVTTSFYDGGSNL